MKNIENSVFNFENHQVRVVMKGTEPWWVAKDIADILDFRDAANAIRLLDEDEKGTQKVSTPGGEQEMSIISESGLYTLLMRSNKPEAKRFRKWVTSEVLPTIRRHGMYATEAAAQRFINDPNALEVTLRCLLEERNKVEALEAQAGLDAPKVAFFDAVSTSPSVLSMAEAAKLLNFNGVGPIKLFRILRAEGILMSTQGRWNVPYQQYISKGYFKLTETSFTDEYGKTFVNAATSVYQKGLDFIRRRLLSWGYTPSHTAYTDDFEETLLNEGWEREEVV